MTIRPTQACITNVSFPATLAGLRGMVRKNSGVKRGWELDFDVLQAYDPATGYEWTAAPWLRRGDLIFFYHAKGAAAHVAKLMAAARRGPLARVLKRAEAYAGHYAGTIFAYARLSADAGGAGRYAAGNHFKTQACAPCAFVHVLERPLPEAVWAPFFQIKRRGAVTPLTARQARRLCACVLRANRQNSVLARLRFGDPALGCAGKGSWHRASRAPYLFRHEQQVREFLADPMLHALADPGTLVLQECRCFRATRYVGQADNLVRVSGRWVPVEVKLDVEAMPAELLRAQLRRYLGLESCMPVLDPRRGHAVPMDGGSACLLVDRHGVYTTQRARFVQCAPGRPRWRFADWAGTAVADIRRLVARQMSDC